MSKKEIAIIEQGGLKNPGDKLSARITDTGRKVLKMETNKGMSKYSATKYKNGTVVETKTTKMP